MVILTATVVEDNMLTWEVHNTKLHGWGKWLNGWIIWKIKTLERGAGCDWKTQIVSEECEGKDVDLGPVVNQLGGIFINLVSRFSPLRDLNIVIWWAIWWTAFLIEKKWDKLCETWKYLLNFFWMVWLVDKVDIKGLDSRPGSANLICVNF